MASNIVCVAVLAAENFPLFIKTIATQSETEELKFHYTVHSSLDVIEEKMTNFSKNTGDGTRDSYLGLLYTTEDYRVYGYVNNSHVKFVILVKSSDNSLRDTDLKSMFKQLHWAYTDAVCNPFYDIGNPITSTSFNKVVHTIMASE